MTTISSHSTSLPNPRHVAAELVGLSTPGSVLSTSDANRIFGKDVTTLPSVTDFSFSNIHKTFFGNRETIRPSYSLVGHYIPVDDFLAQVDKFTPPNSSLRTTEGGSLKYTATSGFFTGESALIFSESSGRGFDSFFAHPLIKRAIQSLNGNSPNSKEYHSYCDNAQFFPNVLPFNDFCRQQFPELVELLTNPKIYLNTQNTLLEEAMRTLAEPFPDIAKGWLATVVNMIKSK
jgi:hypothetical protein